MALCFVDSYPEPTSVTVNENVTQYNGINARWVEEVFTGASLVNHKSGALSYFPVANGAVTLFLNSGAQRQGVDYVLSANMFAMVSPLLDADVVMVKYLAYDTAVPDQELQVGQIVFSANNSAPTGFIVADGTTAHSKEDYAVLYAFATTYSLVLSEDATTFTLKDLSIVAGGVTLSAHIKYN